MVKETDKDVQDSLYFIKNVLILEKYISRIHSIEMARKRQNRKSKLGLAPGTLLFTGQQKMERPEFSVVIYTEHQVQEIVPKSLEEVVHLISVSEDSIWVNIDGIHDETVIENICSRILVHKLTMEDILSVGQRPKIEEFENYIHIVLKMFMMESNGESVDDEQLSFILHKNILISFQEKTGDVFQGVRRRLVEGKGFIRKRGSDYLLYALIDSVVDHYFLILETIGEKIESLETEILMNPDESVLPKLYHLRRETLELRRSVYPLREVISRFEKINESVLNPEVRVFIRDLYDHTVQVIETIEVLRESASGLLDLYMNSVSNKMNEIMKVLTIMASIFIPLTFIAGVYGMNFQYIPELEYKYSYFIVWGVMVLVFVGLIIYFKHKKWL